MEKMNKNVENMINQINNTLTLMDKYGYLHFYNLPGIFTDSDKVLISWNNHQSCREVSSKYFLRIDQYLKILESNAYLAILKDFSIIRCAFKYDHGKLLSENLLWWPCPMLMDSEMVEEFGLTETVELLLNDSETKNNIRMRSPIRVDFDVLNDTIDHPRSHMHTQHEECRINTGEPICFNRFINYIVKCYYPDWKLPFDREDFLGIQYDKRKNIQYSNSTEVYIGY